MTRQKGLHRAGLVLVVNADNPHARGLESVEGGVLFDAGCAPGGEEVDQGDALDVIADAVVRRRIKPLQRHLRQGFSHQGVRNHVRIMVQAIDAEQDRQCGEDDQRYGGDPAVHSEAPVSPSRRKASRASAAFFQRLAEKIVSAVIQTRARALRP